jgi:hypothetical protein
MGESHAEALVAKALRVVIGHLHSELVTSPPLALAHFWLLHWRISGQQL